MGVLLYISENGDHVVPCPICEREMLPAYYGEDGLDVGFWTDWDPGDVTEGLLVCGDLNCEHEERVTFTKDRTDAVVISMDRTIDYFIEETCGTMPASAALSFADEVEEVFKATGRAKLHCAAEYYREIAESRLEQVDAWLAEAEDKYDVEFRTDMGEHKGRILSHSEDQFVLVAEDGSIRPFAKADICYEHIDYPRKPVTRRINKKNNFVMVGHVCFIVVEGHHLHYLEGQEDGRFYATTQDPAVGEALRMKKMGACMYEGYFHRDEVERYYIKRNMAKIQGHWLRDHGPTCDHEYHEVETTDPEIAKDLDMPPFYELIWTDFGLREGDKVEGYRDYFPNAAIEETSWYEESQELPTYEDCM